MAFIETRDLTVRYPHAQAPAVEGVSFAVQRGHMALLLGPSGSGKSTIGLALAGLIPSSVPAVISGDILIGGNSVMALEVAQRTAQVGIVFQDPEAQFCMLRVDDEIAFGLENVGLSREEMGPRISEALDAVGLASRKGARIDRLSGGQKQRLALACALARKPQVLFLDEPTANLDPAARQEFFDHLCRLHREDPSLTVLVVEHILDDLIDLVDQLILVGHLCDRRSRWDASDSPRSVFEQHAHDLDEMGIWLPQVTALAHKLRRAGVPIDTLPLDVPEAARLFAPQLVARHLPEPEESVGTRSTAEAVRTSDLSYTYPGGNQALCDVSLSVGVGDFLAVLGPNGSGKSTLGAHIAGILSSQQVLLFGDRIDSLALPDITERVGYVFQNPEHQFIEQHVDDELAYSLRARHWPETQVRETVEDLLARFGLSELRHASPFALSQGQKRRLSVATMLAVGQRLLILDEPTFGQDRRTAGALMQQLCDLHRQGVTIMMITHDMQLVADYADRVAVLVGGRLAFDGPVPMMFGDLELLHSASLRPPPLHALARELGVTYNNGTLPRSLRDWYPFFGVASGERGGCA